MSKKEYEIQGYGGYSGADIVATFRFPKYMHQNKSFAKRQQVSFKEKAEAEKRGEDFEGFDNYDFMPKDGGIVMFAELSTVSYSTYKDKFPVRALGYTRAKGYTSGTRTVAGTLIFKVLNKNIINKMIKRLDFSCESQGRLNILPDDLPPFDIDIIMTNELGDSQKISLIGVELTEGNQIMSSDQLNIDETYSFVAEDLVVHEPGLSARQYSRQRQQAIEDNIEDDNEEPSLQDFEDDETMIAEELESRKV